MDIEEKKRICKKCDSIKVLSLFTITQNKKSKTQTHSHTCKDCEKSKRQTYFKAYHKTHYISRKKKKEEKTI